MNERCTWIGCSETATHPQVGKDGTRWANLCAAHNLELSDAVARESVPRIVAAWVKAQGGAKAAAARMRIPTPTKGKGEK